MDSEKAVNDIETARERFSAAVMGGKEDFTILMTTMGDVMVHVLLAVLEDAEMAETFLDGMHAKIRRWELERSSSLPVQ